MDMTTGIKGQLDAMHVTTSADPSHGVRTTNIVGMFDEIDDVSNTMPSGDFQEWLLVSQ
jgi:hypothetical protein